MWPLPIPDPARALAPRYLTAQDKYESIAERRLVAKQRDELYELFVHKLEVGPGGRGQGRRAQGQGRHCGKSMYGKAEERRKGRESEGGRRAQNHDGKQLPQEPAMVQRHAHRNSVAIGLLPQPFLRPPTGGYPPAATTCPPATS